MRRLALFGVLLALPLVAVPLVWAAASGGAADASLTEFRQAAVRPAPAAPAPAVSRLAATPTRVSFTVGRAGGAEVEIRDASGRLVQRLGHFTLAAGQRVVVAWRGARVVRGAVAVVTAAGRRFETPVEVRRSVRADDADRQSLRQPGHA